MHSQLYVANQIPLLSFLNDRSNYTNYFFISSKSFNCKLYIVWLYRYYDIVGRTGTSQLMCIRGGNDFQAIKSQYFIQQHDLLVRKMFCNVENDVKR